LFKKIDCYDVDFLIVGAGFAGSVVAERLASQGFQVFIIDKGDHVAGNAFDQFDSHGILIHQYGPHIFHTQYKEVFKYLSNFTEWLPYEHRVQASVEGKLVPLPINLTTVNLLYNLNLDESGMIKFLEQVREEKIAIVTSEDVVVSQVGRDLYEKLFKGYTRKQWGIDPSELDAIVTARLPVRTNTDDRYFSDQYQAMPVEGFTKLFTRMLEHPNIQFEPGVDFSSVKARVKAKHIVFTGPIDEYYECCFGRLPYRSLRFEFFHIPNVDFVQPVGVINYPNDHNYTRISEFKHLTGQKTLGSTLLKEYPQPHGSPYYPVPRSENNRRFMKYWKLAEKESKVTFHGRLALYRYLNMDQVVLDGLKLATLLAARIGN
jgi:UDP-galactopyranose mutase